MRINGRFTRFALRLHFAILLLLLLLLVSIDLSRI